MKDFLLMLLLALTALSLTIATQAYGQVPAPGATGPLDQGSGDFPSAARTDFPATTGSGDFPAASNPQGFDTTMPESGLGTGTNSTLGGSGTGSGGLSPSTNGPYTSSPVGTNK
ncbi:MAG: hypothetical protein ABSD38_30135 [Syntrophorhabdales bacterium]|jgi:hypothetical protein